MKNKKLNAIETLGNSNMLTVQKSLPLIALWKSNLTLTEFKILDIYLGRINSHDDEHRTVKFEKGEIEKILGLKQMKTKVLDERIEHLMTTVKIPDKSKKNGFMRISLFEKAYAEQIDGMWQVYLTCTSSAKEYIFNIDNIGYLRYKLRNIVNLASRYSYILFLYLENNRAMHLEWNIELSDLKEILSCTEESYNQFKVFNDRILKRTQKEINEKTECFFTYETIKKGRRVSKIRFKLKPKMETKLEIIECSNDNFNEPKEEKEGSEEKYISEAVEFLAEACEKEFSNEEMQVIFTLLSTSEKNFYSESGVEIARFEYLLHKYNLLNLECKKRKIKNRFAYFKKMIENDLKK